MVLKTWVKTCVYACMLTVGIELCGIFQVCDAVMHINVCKVDMKPQCMRDCALEALRLRKRRVKRLKASKRVIYWKFAATRHRHAIARLQFVLHLSIWNMLNNGVGAVDEMSCMDECLQKMKHTETASFVKRVFLLMLMMFLCVAI